MSGAASTPHAAGGCRRGRFRGAGAARLVAPDGIETVLVARRLGQRLAGLAALAPERAPALLIPRCRSIHTAAMRLAIDVVFLLPAPDNPAAEVLAVHRRVGPWRIISHPRRAPGGAGSAPARVATLELPGGRARPLGISSGAVVGLEPLPGGCALAAGAAPGRVGERD